MKFQAERVELEADEFGTTENDEQLFVVIPKGLKEGQVRRIREIGRSEGDRDGRLSNAEILRLVREWNFDDGVGKTLPLMSTLLTDGQTLNDLPKAKKEAAETILREIPVQFFGWIARRLVNKQSFTEAAEGFSKTSSGE